MNTAKNIHTRKSTKIYICLLQLFISLLGQITFSCMDRMYDSGQMAVELTLDRVYKSTYFNRLHCSMLIFAHPFLAGGSYDW